MTNKVITKSIAFGKHILTLETGKVARQASGAVIVKLGETTLLATAVGIDNPENVKNFIPLRADYQERSYAVGKIPGGFFKREGRPSEREILISRLIDRPIRPLFPEGFGNEVQLVVTLLSLDPEVDSDIPALIGASAALAISGIPITESMAAVKVGYINKELILNPSKSELVNSDLELVVAGTLSSVLMVESEAHELPEATMLEAVMFGHRALQPVVKLINELAQEVDAPKWIWQSSLPNQALVADIKAKFLDKIANCYQIKAKTERQLALKHLRQEIIATCIPEGTTLPAGNEAEISTIVSNLESELVRHKILRGEPRIDGRDNKSIRPITVQTSFLPRVHGSALFTRGETQALVVTTLGSSKDAQIIDSPLGEYKDDFMLHYNFPPFCVGEVGQIGSPKRREIGHGKLAKRGISPVLPKNSTIFPYTIRVVSEITESNGSSSMATVCGSSLALMDAGVPIKDSVAGIAMGLILEHGKFAIISDILGDEDHLGDMDFKVAGTKQGITALQMDIKINGITEEIMQAALEQARVGRLHILNIMNQALDKPKTEISSYAPQITTIKINPDKIKDVIGKGGSTIKALTEEYSTSIDIKEDGSVQIASPNKTILAAVVERINEITAELELGEVYEGTVMRLESYGAFVNVLPGKDGLLHISQIANRRIENINEVLQEGQKVKVKVIEIDKMNRVKLSMKEVESEVVS